ncbi:MAG: 50S ribosomal protein L2 [Myxococcota bacterium]|jgi:large subunit ribosomal protein L2|nr:50S ribosomal protein L2 [Deltaproteobacteria bacterium]MCP4244510.1 50S ribosomal protein L2 [bacterium]MDP6075854.1 50S ribosomal protein L2 [Myxococcota bacterium]MBT39413.1 50S ribosomal protein L2 [Deltaproteobacteria bacterium]MDP7075865.1 50S ribosomal protein L2 [Myxococcota bacterium]
MGIKNYKPTSPGRRGMSVSEFSDVTRAKPERSLVEGGISKSGGRNVNGRITSWHRGGGHKRRYRRIDFRRDKIGIPARVAAIEYDPNRSAHIALLHYRDGEKRYVLAPAGVRVGDVLESGPEADVRPGNALPIGRIPLGTVLHAIEMKPGKGAQLVRAAGLGAQVMAREGRYATLRMPSGEHRLILVDCMATIGSVGNPDHENQTLGKAGRNRWRGRRGNVRGVAMNPVDHPMGGGEGRSSGGRHPCTPWGVPTKGHKTRHNRRTQKYIVKRRGKK